MSAIDDQLAQFSTLAITAAARELGVEPLTLARRLNQAEIARLVHLLNACLTHVDHQGLRHRTEDLLSAVTDGRMPDDRPESQLDWALKVAKRRRSPADGQLSVGADEEP
jgi:hypothetical protein